ncbi:uncharacterized protein GGS22DRAFT_171507 [Annulohypoxylon maeteangense]|uniref:uncharacterized protein n=1 Tax=Annulohypoxylon maeteangense TaxID=1927788 RepID=UPI0020073772|nr:uncharacterized protein GGS22DRAFT_171507 [Annulohypoxylon maeteangense]KAI0881641.1 hypothetical protein GGS22DRAFT_171507 [Annulohypoxylon maeteangense]
METNSRRKACDTCFKKKIKCDMLKPTCSNCLLYKVPCSTTILRRRPNPVPPKGIQTVIPAVSGDSLEARLARIEAKLDRLGGPGPSTTADQLLDSESCRVEESTASPTAGPSSSCAPVHRGDYHIPPLTEILPIIEDYFNNFNPALPLFHQSHFMHMLYDFYSRQEETKDSRAAWAAVNVVLAIGYRIRSIETENIMVGFDDGKAKKCIDNAQKELDELVTREEDTLGVQVLLGLVILFQTNTDQKPASVLIGTAVRLAHRLQLHIKSTLSDYAPEVARHRSNLFWLCYCLDKDVSLRSKIPSIQDDGDVDLDLPGTESGDDGNYLSSIDGHTQLNYLRVRVQLAYLEGKVYDDLLSNRSTKVSSETRQARAAHLFRLLDQWLRKIPEELRLENITKTVDKAPLTHMILLYHTYLMCSATLNGLYSLASPWIKSVSGFTVAALEHFDFQAHACMRHQQPLLPQFWDTCVSTSRGCLQILNNKTYSGCNLWISGCAYFSAFIVLLANIIYFPLHGLVDHDRGLTITIMGRMENLLAYAGSESFQKLHMVLVGLGQAADRAAEQAKMQTETHESVPSVNTQPHCSWYPSSSSEGLPDDPGHNLVPEWTWPQVSTLDDFGMGFEFDDGTSLPEFMRSS